ncbi:hypothetical protein RHMOL_Rhmol05G0259400 [Rhododendron molle]|uniref:Uncharacterized protein n=1 Tax=Rhododendron molle TaxID=49168 RepID=A0ACC0NSZ6_RHOML|nr:hypothetical protein RHMOL_Rhmol05G0259400 [Rhododendron molle]
MARITKRERRKKAKREALVALLCIMRTVNIVLSLYMLIRDLIGERVRQRPRLRLNPNVYQHQIDNLNRLVRGSDTDCHNQLRVNRLPNSMESQRTSKSKRTNAKGRQDKQSRRLWTPKEEEALLACMLDAVTEKETWKAHNGFKSGFYVEVEQSLQKLLPGTTLKAQPNIESRVKFWKEKYGQIADMIRLSGFAWNHATNSIEVDSEDVWKEYEKFNPKVKGMNGKAFPMYESWQILFGIDRATGDFAEDAADLDNCDLVQSPNQDEIPDIDDYLEECYTPRFANGEAIWPGDTFADLSYANTPTTNSNANVNTPTTDSSANTPTTNSNANVTSHANVSARAKANSNTRANVNTNPNARVNANPNARINANVVPMPAKKKAKKEVAMPEALGNYLTQSATVMEKIADAIGYDKQLSSRREKVFEELLKLDMDEDDRYIVNAIIVQAEDRVDTFYGIPAERKQRWVELVLAGKFYGKDK